MHKEVPSLASSSDLMFRSIFPNPRTYVYDPVIKLLGDERKSRAVFFFEKRKFKAIAAAWQSV